MKKLLTTALIFACSAAALGQSKPKLRTVGLPDTVRIVEGADTTLYLDEHIGVDGSYDLSVGDVIWEFAQNADFPALRPDPRNGNALTLSASHERLDRERGDIATTIRFTAFHQADDLLSVTDSLVVALVPVNDPPRIKDTLKSLSVPEDSARSVDLSPYVISGDTDLRDLEWRVTRQGSLVVAGVANHVLALRQSETRPDTPGNDRIVLELFEKEVPSNAASREVAITVTAVDDPPVIAEDYRDISVRLLENTGGNADTVAVKPKVLGADNTSRDIRWTVNQGDTTNVKLRFELVREPLGGEVWVLSVQAVPHYFNTPEKPDLFGIEVTDGRYTDQARVTVFVKMVPDLPRLQFPEGGFVVVEDSILSVILDKYVRVDRAVEEKSGIWWEVLSSVHTGGLVDNEARVATFEPQADWNGYEEVVFRATGAAGAVTDTVRVYVDSRPDPPRLLDSVVIELPEDQRRDVAAKEIAVDADPNDQLRVRLDASPVLVGDPLVTVRSAAVGDGWGLVLSPRADTSGSTELKVIVADQTGRADTGWVKVVVKAVNDPPRIVAKTVTFLEDTPETVLPLTEFVEDIDDPVDVLQWEEARPATDSSVTARVDNVRRTVTFHPLPDFSGARDISFAVRDSSGARGVGLVRVVVNNVNDAPAFTGVLPASLRMQEDQAYLLDLRQAARDVDDSWERLTWSVEASDTTALHASIANGFASLVPGKDWTGTGSLRVTAVDPAGGRTEEPFLIEVNVAPVNDAPEMNIPSLPVAGGQRFTEGDTLFVDLAPFVSDVDNSDRELSYYCTQGMHILCRTEETTAILWTSGPQWYGTELVRFGVRDPGNLQDEQSVAVAVSTVDDCPDISAIPDIALSEDGVYSFDLDEFVVDPDTPKPAISWEVTEVDSIEVELDASFHTVTVRPARDFWGRRQVTFVASGGCGSSVRREVTIGVSPANDPPQVRERTLVMEEDGRLAVRRDSLVFDVDDPLTVLTTSVRALGRVQVEPQTEGFAFSAPADYWGRDSVEVRVIDGSGAVGVDTLQVVVNGVNDPPVISAPAYLSISEDADTTLDLDNYVLDVDTPLERLQWSVDDSAGGPVQVTIDPRTHVAVVRGARDYSGITDLKLVVVDEHAAPFRSLVSPLQVEVKPVNDPPAIKLQQLSFGEDESAELRIEELVEDVDNTRDQLRWTVQGDRLIDAVPLGDRVRLAAARDAFGVGRLFVKVYDFEDSTQGYVAVNVKAVSDPPDISALPAAVSFAEDANPPYSMDLDDFVTDIDTPAREIQWTVSDPSGSVAVRVDPVTHVAVFRTRQDFAGLVEVLLTAVDGELPPVQRSSRIEVLPVNDPPVLTTRRLELREGEGKSFGLHGWVQDIDDDFDELAWEVSTAEGSILRAWVDGDSLLLLTRSKDDFGAAFLTVRVEDPGQRSDSAVVRVDVLPVNDPPVVAPIPEKNTPEDTPLEVDITPFLQDVDTRIEDLSIYAASSTVGSVDVDGKLLTVHPLGNFCGPGQVDFAVTDREDSVPSAFGLRVVCVNDRPALSVPPLRFGEGESRRFSLRGWATDAEDAISLLQWNVRTSQGGMVRARIDGEALELFADDLDAHGEEQIQIEVQDSGGLRATAYVQVTVAPVDDAPALARIPAQYVQEDQGGDFYLGDFISDVDDSLGALTISVFGGIPAQMRGLYLHVDPPQEFCGTDTVFVTVKDPSGKQASGAVDVVVQCINDPPELLLRQVDLVEDRSDTIRLADLVADVDDSLERLSLDLSSSAHIAVRKTSGGYVLTPEPDWNGTEVLTARMEDKSTSVLVPLPVAVDPVFDIELRVPDLLEDEDYQVAGMEDYLDERRAGERVFWKTASSEHIQVTIDNALGALTIRLATDWFGQEYVTLQALGSEGRLDQVEIPVTVRPVNDPPMVNLEQLSIPEDSTVTLDLGEWVTDADDPAEDLRCVVAGDLFEVVSADEGRSCVYRVTPPPDWHGSAMLNVQVTDAAGGQTSADIPVEVVPRADEFTFEMRLPEVITIRENESYTLDLEEYVEGIDGKAELMAPQRLGVTTSTSDERITAARNGAQIVVSSNDYIGPGTVTVRLFDLARGIELSDSVSVEYTAYRPPRYVGSPTYSFSEDGFLELWVDTLATDPDNRVRSLEWSLSPDKSGPVVVSEYTAYRQDGSGKVDTLNIRRLSSSQEDWNGSTQVLLIVRDPSGNEDSTTVNLEVLPVNDPPRIQPALAALLQRGVTEDDSLVVPLDSRYVWDDDALGLLVWQFEVVEEQNRPHIRVSANLDGVLSGTDAVPSLVLKPNPDWEGSLNLRFWALDRGYASSDTQQVPITVVGVQDAPRISSGLPAVITLGKSRRFDLPLKPFLQDVDGDLVACSVQLPEQSPFDKDHLVRKLAEQVLSLRADSLWGQGGPVTLRLLVSDGRASATSPPIQVYSDPGFDFPLPAALEPLYEDQASLVEIPGASFPPGTRVLAQANPASLVPPSMAVEGINSLRPALPANWSGDITLLFQVPFTFDTGSARPYTTVGSASVQVEPVNDPPDPFGLLRPGDGDTLLSEIDFRWEATEDPDREPVGYLVNVALDTLFITGLREVAASVEHATIKVVEQLPTGPAQKHYWRVTAQDPVFKGTVSRDRMRAFYVKGMPTQPVLVVGNLGDGFLREASAVLSWTPVTDPDGDTFEEYRIYVHADSDLVVQSDERALLERVRPEVGRFAVARSADGRALRDEQVYFAKVETRTVNFGLTVSGMTRFSVDLPQPLTGLRLTAPISGTPVVLQSAEDSVAFSWASVDTSLNRNDRVRYRLAWWPLEDAHPDTSWQDSGDQVVLSVPRSRFVVGPYGWRVTAESQYGGTLESEVGTFLVEIKDTILDLSNYPNPMRFAGETTIDFRLCRAADVTVRVFDQSGAMVRVIAERQRVLPPYGELRWDGRDGSGRPLARGIYLCHMRAEPVDRAVGDDTAKHWIAVFRE
jgi:hypothetical protein